MDHFCIFLGKSVQLIMFEKSLLVLIINFCAIYSAPTSQNDLEAEITKFHVNSRIQLRYAITDVETQIKNRHFLPKEVFFDMYIPEEAFVSDFSMVIKDKTYQAKVEPKKVAEETFENSFSTSALLQSNSQPEFTDGQQVSNLGAIHYSRQGK